VSQADQPARGRARHRATRAAPTWGRVRRGGRGWQAQRGAADRRARRWILAFRQLNRPPRTGAGPGRKATAGGQAARAGRANRDRVDRAEPDLPGRWSFQIVKEYDDATTAVSARWMARPATSSSAAGGICSRWRWRAAHPLAARARGPPGGDRTGRARIRRYRQGSRPQFISEYRHLVSLTSPEGRCARWRCT
jgi:hypothetical protein